MTTYKVELAEEDRDQIYDAINEALAEIRRLNEARGETVFNPAATSALRAARETLRGV